MAYVHRTPIIVANWKMNTNLPEAMILAGGIKDAVADIHGVKVVICPPAPWIYPIADSWHRASKQLFLGAQNIHWEKEGPFTGEISAWMVKNLVKYVIIGHSERRFHFRETDELINDKVIAALEVGLRPILCVGEWSKDDAKNLMTKQLLKGLERVGEEKIKRVVIAYEPVWAISKGGAFRAATGEYVAERINIIREKIKEKYSRDIADDMTILYGGSVNRANIEEFISQDGIDGALVGAASLKLREFVEICRLASSN